MYFLDHKHPNASRTQEKLRKNILQLHIYQVQGQKKFESLFKIRLIINSKRDFCSADKIFWKFKGAIKR